MLKGSLKEYIHEVKCCVLSLVVLLRFIVYVTEGSYEKL